MIELKEKNFGLRFKEYATHVLKNGFIADEENREQINEAIKIFNAGEKGLMFMGNPGSGKTIFFEISKKIINPRDSRQFLIKNVLDIVLEFNTEGHEVFKKYRHQNILFDDLGTEGLGHFYGDKVEVMTKFIEMRYAHYRENKCITHFTTNLNSKEILARYGLRVDSRLKEICRVIKLGGSENYTDRRRYDNFISMPDVYHEKILTEKEKKDIEDDLRVKEWYMIQKMGPHQKEVKGIGMRLKEFLGTEKK